jgi:hypothetical protein
MSAPTTTRLTALRLIGIDSLIVKEPMLPVAFKLSIIDPLSDAQLNRLVLATPWKPITVEAHVGGWNECTNSFDATIVLIENPPKPPHTEFKKTLRWGQVKQKRGFVFHD